MAAPADQVQAANAALGTSGLRSLQFSAVGQRSQFSQGLWSEYNYMPVRAITRYEERVNFDTDSLRTDTEVTPSATAGYFIGSTHSIEVLSNGFAWSEPIPAAGQGAYENLSATTPQPDMVSERTLWLWGST